MATNGILDIQETVEDFRDPDMELGPDEMMDIIKTLQVVGVPQEQYGEFTEEFRIWKQNNNGTFDMFLEEKYQLPPGTITKIKTTQQVAQGPEDVLTEEDMTIQPGSGEMLDIMQQVGAPPVGAQPSAKGGRIGYAEGKTGADYYHLSEDEYDLPAFRKKAKEIGGSYWGLMPWSRATGENLIHDLYNKKYEYNLSMEEAIADLENQWEESIEQRGLNVGSSNIGQLGIKSKKEIREKVEEGWDQVRGPTTDTGIATVAQGGRIGYQAGEIVLPEPRPEHDPRAGFFERMGAMPEQTLLRQAQPMRGQVPEGIMGQTPDPYGGLLGGQEGDIGMGGQPLGEYEHEGAEQPPSWWDRMRTGTTDVGVASTPDIDMEMIIDFLKKLGMAITKENIAKAAKALGMAMKFGPTGVGTGLGLQGLGSLGGGEEIEETEEIGFQEGGPVFDIDLYNTLLAQGVDHESAWEQAGGSDQMDSVFGVEKKAEGGIIDAVPRQGYFLGKAVKAITGGAKKLLKATKKILKSDIGKMAMLYIATSGFANIAAQQGLGGAQKWFGRGGWQWLKPSKAFGIGEEGFGNIGQALSRLTSKVPYVGKKEIVKNVVPGNTGQMSNYLKEALNTVGALSERQKMAIEAYKKTLEPAASKWYQGALPWIGGSALAGGLYTAKNPGQEQFDTAKRDAEVDDWTNWLAAIQPAPATTVPYPDYAGAKGGRVGYANGGILDIEEIDLRRSNSEITL